MPSDVTADVSEAMENPRAIADKLSTQVTPENLGLVAAALVAFIGVAIIGPRLARLTHPKPKLKKKAAKAAEDAKARARSAAERARASTTGAASWARASAYDAASWSRSAGRDAAERARSTAKHAGKRARKEARRLGGGTIWR